MNLLNTYEDRDEAELALTQITGQKRLVSDREDNQVIYKLFGESTWGNFHRLKMFNLPQLQQIVEQRKAGQAFDAQKHKEITTMLKYAARQFELEIPGHWL